MTKQSYYRILIILVSMIILLIVSLVLLLTNPIIETKIIEVPKEIIVEKEIEKKVPVETEIIVEKIVEVEVEKEVFVEIEPTYVYSISSEEREMLARLVYLEANIESLECQKAVVSVVINRWQNGYWGDTLEDVVYAPNQFSPAYLIPNTTPTNTNYEAVDYVLKNGCTIPEHVLYFRANYHFNWDGYIPYQKMDDTCFGYLQKDKK